MPILRELCIVHGITHRRPRGCENSTFRWKINKQYTVSWKKNKGRNCFFKLVYLFRPHRQLVVESRRRTHRVVKNSNFHACITYLVAYVKWITLNQAAIESSGPLGNCQITLMFNVNFFFIIRFSSQSLPSYRAKEKKIVYQNPCVRFSASCKPREAFFPSLGNFLISFHKQFITLHRTLFNEE